MKQLLSLLILFLTLSSCEVKKSTADKLSQNISTPEAGAWLFSMDLGAGDILEFEFEFTDAHHGVILNADERITVDEIMYKGDSIFMMLPVFDSEFKGKVNSNSSIEGYWYNYAKSKDYKIAFKAERTDKKRYACKPDKFPLNNGDNWEVHFSPNNPEDAYDAIGLFRSVGDAVHGTFLTETGDYRYLAGSFCRDTLILSCFDGSHAFLFKAHFSAEDKIDQGYFKSGTHWSEPWVANINPGFELRNPFSLTYIKDGYDGIKFSFPNIENEMVEYPSDRFEDKVTIIEIMGSWCPNCLDETKLLTEISQKKSKKDLEIVALCFEKSDVHSIAMGNVKRLRDHLNADYTFLYAGVASKSEANKQLPMLNHIMSFPTTIFIDKKGKVRKIHTGFYGPGTGEKYKETVEEFNKIVDELIAE